MMSYLVAVDNSDRARLVLAHAGALARATGAKLILFRALGLPSEIPIEAYAVSPDDVIEVLKKQATAELEELARGLSAGVSFSIQLAVGVAWQAICAAARTEPVALIVIGSHGYSGLDRLLGTTAARVVNHADRSVLVVRDPAASMGSSSAPKKV